MTPTLAPSASLLGLSFLSVCIALAAAWGGFALWYKASASRLAQQLCLALWAAFAIAALAAVWRGHAAYGGGAFSLLLAALLGWWRKLRAARFGDWADDVANITTGEVDGNSVIMHNVRNFDWCDKDHYTQRWESRSYELDSLHSVDIVMSYWRGPAIAHMLMSFGFANGAYVAFSVEIRRRKIQKFSEIGGFFKEFELCIIAADEYDVIRLRTNIRGERVHIYRLMLPPRAIRSLFLSYIAEGNKLAAEPRFYNTITVNCTTLVYQMMRRIVGPLPLSYRLLFSGYIPEYVFGVGGFDRRFSLEQLRRRGFSTDRALKSERREDFSTDIRRGLPGACAAGREAAVAAQP